MGSADGTPYVCGRFGYRRGRVSLTLRFYGHLYVAVFVICSHSYLLVQVDLVAEYVLYRSVFKSILLYQSIPVCSTIYGLHPRRRHSFRS